MKIFTSPLALMALAVASLSSPLVQAASASSALSNVYIQLFDLDPLDGIAPSIMIGNTSFIFGTVFDGASNDFNNNGPLGDALSGAASIGASSTASAVFAGNLFLPDSGNGVSSMSEATGLGTSAYSYGMLHNHSFTVTAKTLVVLTATGQATAAAALGEYATAVAYVGMQDVGGSNYSYGQAYSTVEANGNTYGIGGPLSVQASFVNLNAAPQDGSLFAIAYSNVIGVVAVPEPGRYALMLAGILALGFVGKRRSRG